MVTTSLLSWSKLLRTTRLSVGLVFFMLTILAVPYVQADNTPHSPHHEQAHQTRAESAPALCIDHCSTQSCCPNCALPPFRFAYQPKNDSLCFQTLCSLHYLVYYTPNLPPPK